VDSCGAFIDVHTRDRDPVEFVTTLAITGKGTRDILASGYARAVVEPQRTFVDIAAFKSVPFESLFAVAGEASRVVGAFSF